MSARRALLVGLAAAGLGLGLGIGPAEWSAFLRTPHAVAAENTALRDTADRTRTKVVILKTTRATGRGSGTGFLAGPKLVVTAGHVVTDAKEITAWVNGVAYSARVAGRHPEVDLAALRLRAPDLLLKPAELAETAEDLAAEEPLLILAGPSQGPTAKGDPATRALLPMQFERRISVGGVTGRPTPMLAMKGTVQRGDSGSPVLRIKDGRVVGVLSSRSLPDEDGVSRTAYAVPVEQLNAWLRTLPAPSPEQDDEDFYLKR